MELCIFSERMWSDLVLLPADVVSRALNLLSAKDLVRLEEAWPSSNRLQLHHEYFARLPPINLPNDILWKHCAYQWAWARNLRVESVSVPMDEFDVLLFRENVHLFDGIEVACEDSVEEVQLMQIAAENGLFPMIKALKVIGKSTAWELSSAARYALQEICNLHTLEVRAIGQLATTWATTLLENNSHIRTLALAANCSDTFDLVRVAMNTPHVHCLTSLSVQHVDVNEDHLAIIAQRCPHLKSFTLHSCNRRFREEGFFKIAQDCHELQEIFIGYGKKLPGTLYFLAKNCPNLRTIIIVHATLNDEMLKVMVTNCQHIVRLNVNWKVNSLKIVKYEAKHFWAHISALELYCDELSWPGSEALAAAIKLAKHLRALELHHMKPAHLVLVEAVTACEGLTKLDLSWFESDKYKHSGIDTSWADAQRSNHVSGLVLQAVQRNSRSLTELGIGGSDCLVQDQTIREIVTHVPNVQRLRVRARLGDWQDLALNDGFICLIAQHCPHLQDYDPQPNISDGAVMMLAMHCHRLKQLDVRHSYQVTEAALTELITCGSGPLELTVPANWDKAVLERLQQAGKTVRRGFTVGYPRKYDVLTSSWI